MTTMFRSLTRHLVYLSFFYLTPPLSLHLSFPYSNFFISSLNHILSCISGAEATIDIDSLYEGADYSSKVTRARFEDLISIPLIQVCQQYACIRAVCVLCILT